MDSAIALDSSEESSAHEDDYCAVDFERFSRDGSVFADPPPDPTPRFVYEVIMRRNSDSQGVHVWDDITPANDPNQKQRLFEEYFSGKDSSRLYRARFEFCLCFHNWVEATDSFDQIQIRLKDQCDAIKRLKHWSTQGKIKVLNTDSSPSMLYFITTPDLFQKVYSHPGISSAIYDTEIVTLATS